VSSFNYFAQDNFTTRRTTGHNMLDPESVITGRELAKGLDYRNSKRLYASIEQYNAAVDGSLSVEQIEVLCPRVRGYAPASYSDSYLELESSR
jgi:hypothetical protein